MGSSEVSQLCEMNAELSSCKENNDRTRQEVNDIRVMIGLQEKRLESQVSVTNRHRSGKAAATAAVEKRVQAVRPTVVAVIHLRYIHFRHSFRAQLLLCALMLFAETCLRQLDVSRCENAADLSPYLPLALVSWLLLQLLLVLQE